jgi:copper chaperone
MTETDSKNLLPMAEASCSCCATDAAEAPAHAADKTGANVTASYKVAGMTCSHCASSVTAEVTKLPGVSKVEVDVASGRVTVTSQAPLETESFVAAVDEAGYEVVSA